MKSDYVVQANSIFLIGDLRLNINISSIKYNSTSSQAILGTKLSTDTCQQIVLTF